MRSTERLAQLILECMPELDGGATAQRFAAEELAKIIERRFGKPNLPRAGESVGVTLSKLKTGVLFFDRVWFAPGMSGGPPVEATAFGATDAEVWPLVLILSLHPPTSVSWQMVQDVFGTDTVVAELWERKAPAAKTISDALFAAHGLDAVPMYDSDEACAREYRPGETQAIVAAIERLGIVDETRLDWQQVMDFRKDPEAKTKLRRMRHWLDAEFAGKPLSQITDAIATRLDDYEWALKKHGIETVTGSLAELLDVRFLPAASAAATGLAVAGGPAWAAIGTAALVVGKAALSVTTRLVDLKDRKRGKGSEVAFIHELKSISAT